MALVCPNKRSEEWKSLLKVCKGKTSLASLLFTMNDNNIPSVEEAKKMLNNIYSGKDLKKYSPEQLNTAKNLKEIVDKRLSVRVDKNGNSSIKISPILFNNIREFSRIAVADGKPIHKTFRVFYGWVEGERKVNIAIDYSFNKLEGEKFTLRVDEKIDLVDDNGVIFPVYVSKFNLPVKSIDINSKDIEFNNIIYDITNNLTIKDSDFNFNKSMSYKIISFLREYARYTGDYTFKNKKEITEFIKNYGFSGIKINSAVKQILARPPVFIENEKDLRLKLEVAGFRKILGKDFETFVKTIYKTFPYFVMDRVYFEHEDVDVESQSSQISSGPIFFPVKNKKPPFRKIDNLSDIDLYKNFIKLLYSKGILSKETIESINDSIADIAEEYSAKFIDDLKTYTSATVYSSKKYIENEITDEVCKFLQKVIENTGKSAVEMFENFKAYVEQSIKNNSLIAFINAYVGDEKHILTDLYKTEGVKINRDVGSKTKKALKQAIDSVENEILALEKGLESPSGNFSIDNVDDLRVFRDFIRSVYDWYATHYFLDNVDTGNLDIYKYFNVFFHEMGHTVDHYLRAIATDDYKRFIDFLNESLLKLDSVFPLIKEVSKRYSLAEKDDVIFNEIVASLIGGALLYGNIIRNKETDTEFADKLKEIPIIKYVLKFFGDQKTQEMFLKHFPEYKNISGNIINKIFGNLFGVYDFMDNVVKVFDTIFNKIDKDKAYVEGQIINNIKDFIEDFIAKENFEKDFKISSLNSVEKDGMFFSNSFYQKGLVINSKMFQKLGVKISNDAFNEIRNNVWRSTVTVKRIIDSSLRSLLYKVDEERDVIVMKSISELVADLLKDNITNNYIPKSIAEVIMTRLSTIQDEVSIEIDTSVESYYDEGRHKIVIGYDALESVEKFYKVLSHELMHAITTKGLVENREFRKEMENLMKVANSVQGENVKVFSDVFEFTATFFTSQEYRDTLKPQDKEKKYNIFERILIAIARFLGIELNLYRNYNLNYVDAVSSATEVLKGYIESSSNFISPNFITKGARKFKYQGSEGERTKTATDFQAEAHRINMSANAKKINVIAEKIKHQFEKRLEYMKKSNAFKSSEASVKNFQKSLEDLKILHTKKDQIINAIKIAIDEIEKIQKEYLNKKKDIEDGRSGFFGINNLHNWRNDLAYFDFLFDLNSYFKSSDPIKDEFSEKDIKKINEVINSLIATKVLIEDLYNSEGSKEVVNIVTDTIFSEERTKFVEKVGKEWDALPEEEKEKINRTAFINKKVALSKDDILKVTRDRVARLLESGLGDIGFIANLFESALDSRDHIVAMVAKLVTQKEVEMDRKCEPIYDELVDIVDKFFEYKGVVGKIVNNKELYDDILDGNRLVSKFPKQFWDEYLKVRDVGDKIVVDGEEVILTQQQKRKMLKDFLEENAPLKLDEFKEAFENVVNEMFKDGELSKDEFDLIEQSLLTLPFTGNNNFIYSLFVAGYLNEDAFDELSTWLNSNSWNYREPAQRWKDLNKKYWKLMDLMKKEPENPTVVLYKKLSELLSKGNRMLPPSFRTYDRIPGIKAEGILEKTIGTGNSFKRSLIESVEDAFSLTVNDTDRGNASYQDALGNTRYFVPIFYTSELDMSEQSFDLPYIIFKFYRMALNYKEKSKLVSSVEYFKHALGKREVKVEGLVGGKMKTVKGIETNAYKQFVSFIDMSIYGISRKSLGSFKIFGKNVDADKVIDKLMQYTSVNLLSFNVIQGIANVNLGESLQLIESLAKEYVTPKNFNKAHWKYVSSIPEIIRSIGERKPTNLISYLNRMFYIMNEDELDKKFFENNKAVRLAETSAMFFLMHAGEHYMQTRFMLAMLDNIKAIGKDGKVMKENGKELSLLDVMDFKDGKLVYKEGFDEFNTGWTEQDQFLFLYKLKGIFSRLHGEYWQYAQPAIQQMALGRLALQFRKWIYPGIKRRFAIKHYNERLETYVEGNYRTFWRFIGMLVGDLKATEVIIPGLKEEYEKERVYEGREAIKALLGKPNKSELSQHELANIKRTMLEIMFFIGCIILSRALYAILKGMDPDDDDGEWLLAFSTYQFYRLQAELGFYVLPGQTLNVLRSPAATMSTVQSLGKLLSQLTTDPFARYERTRWKGELKIKKYAIDMIPTIRSVNKAIDVREQIKFFLY